MKASRALSIVGTLGLALGLLGGLGGCDPVASASAVDRGQHQYDNYCAPCHNPGAVGNPDIAAPAIAGLPEWYVSDQLHKFRDGVRGARFEDIEGFRMRPMAQALMSGADVDHVSAFVASLPPVEPEPTLEGDATKGAALYGTCTACHGPDGKGIEALHAPPLTQTHDWYLVTQLRKIKAGTRGADPRDTWGATMVPMANTLADEQAMMDVVAHIQTLR